MTSFFPKAECQSPPVTPRRPPLVTKRPFSTERSSAGKDLDVQSRCTILMDKQLLVGGFNPFEKY